MLLRATPGGLIARDTEAERWVSLPAASGHVPAGDALGEAETHDMLAFLAGGDATREAAGAALEAAREDPAVAADPATAGLPFRPRSLRAFMLYESHLVASGRMLVKHFFPAPAARAMAAYERVTHRTFPPLKPKRSFYERPAFYVANHTAVLADREPMWWPSHTRALDFELELAFVLARPLADATPAEAAAAVGGWLVLNDWSARDVQADDARHNIFGPVVKAKTFANSLGCDVLTADDVPDWQRMSGRARVDGELWCEGSTAGAQHDVGAMLAHVSAGERLAAGDVFSTGTMPGCCGLELERWLKPGQTVELEIDRIGTLTNRIDPAAGPRSLP
ncbi:MAG TPA: fumarylacetoacetate hydrolase family protein [Conexibacter sp.]|jgi:2-keto-4-pentenoate hydratase/2-oxohepta-3-ene-1,7-dioic acid hydratase in catechol pathway|nr:fumarylacetoacetate hydrolase family protein [Conexibacter sp.]